MGTDATPPSWLTSLTSGTEDRINRENRGFPVGTWLLGDNYQDTAAPSLTALLFASQTALELLIKELDI